MRKGNGRNKRKEKQEVDEEIYSMKQSENLRAKTTTEGVLNFQFDLNIKLKNEKQKELIKKIHENSIIFVSGPAGTGKTFIALKGALEILKNFKENKVDKILITKPIVEASGSIGFLPGDITTKVEPYMHSFLANFKKLIGPGFTESLYENGIIKFVPLQFMRGNTFENCCVILDESQNVNKVGLKLFLSRIGENARLIILGDCDQTDLDLKKGEKSGLEDAFERFQDLKKVAFMEFTEDDIVRSSILIELMKRYKK